MPELDCGSETGSETGSEAGSVRVSWLDEAAGDVPPGFVVGLFAQLDAVMEEFGQVRYPVLSAGELRATVTGLYAAAARVQDGRGASDFHAMRRSTYVVPATVWAGLALVVTVTALVAGGAIMLGAVRSPV